MNGRQHPHRYDDLFWARVFGSVISEAYSGLLVWDRLARQATKLARLRKKYRRVISPDELLPEEFMKALLLFRHTLKSMSRGPISNIKMGLGASSPIAFGLGANASGQRYHEDGGRFKVVRV